MRRTALAVLLTAAVATSAQALDWSPQLDREYTDRLLTMDDTAAAHAALARWCAEVGLAEKAERHWKETLLRDRDHAEARAALGHVRRGEEWVKAAASPGVGVPEADEAEPADPTRRERQVELARRIRTIYVEQLGAIDPATWQKGRDAVLMLRDPAAAAPVHEILSSGNEKTRVLMCEVLGQLPGREAARRLVRVLLKDPSRAVYDAAVAALEMRSDEHALQPLLNALDGSEETLQRAAHALGELRTAPAVPKLITRLTTREPRVKTYKAPRSALGGGAGAYFFSGKIHTYIADVEPVVAEGAVGWDPTVGAIPSGALIDVDHVVVTVRRTVFVSIRQPEVRKALEKITGRDFEFDQAAWRRWYRRQQAGAGTNE
ncbi:MAG: HEAT repeat domain-containing protein [Phycisphaerae bacterium]